MRRIVLSVVLALVAVLFAVPAQATAPVSSLKVQAKSEPAEFRPNLAVRFRCRPGTGKAEVKVKVIGSKGDWRRAISIAKPSRFGNACTFAYKTKGHPYYRGHYGYSAGCEQECVWVNDRSGYFYPDHVTWGNEAIALNAFNPDIRGVVLVFQSEKFKPGPAPLHINEHGDSVPTEWMRHFASR